MSEPTARDLAADVEDAIAKVATNGTIVCQCCNASDVTDDDHRDGCPVWELRRAVQAQVDTLTRERENDAWAARESVRVAHDAIVEKEAAEAALADTRRALEDFANHGTRFDTNPTVMIVNDEAWMRHHQWWVGRATDMDNAVRDRARRALAAGDKP